MEIRNAYISNTIEPDFLQTIKSATNSTAKDLNCIRIGIVQEFRAEDITAIVQIASKRVVAYNPDGTQLVKDYAPIRAKVCYCSPYETFPLFPGDEVVLLFNDRELETWFINGQSNLQNHPRMHDLSDCIAIAGIRSLPKMIEILTDCLHLFYGEYNDAVKFSDIKVKEEDIYYDSENHTMTGRKKVNIEGKDEINTSGKAYTVKANTLNLGSVSGGSTTITSKSNITNTGTINSTVLQDATAATGSFTSADGKTITVVNGIVRSIT